MTTSPTRPSRRRRIGASAVALLVAACTATACSSSSDPAGSSPGTPKVVASTNVYGDLAKQVAGDRAEVTSVITDPNADPHSFEASPADAARVTGATVVVYNGGGYDGFVDKALSNAPGKPVVRAVDEFRPAPGQPVTPVTENEHVWYSVPTLIAVVEAVAARLSEVDPDDATTYRANAAAATDRLRPLEKTLADVRARSAGPGARPVDYAQTEPVARHLLDSAGLRDVTPHGFTSAVEDGADPSAADYDAMNRLVGDRKIAFLAFNPQTETPVTGRLARTADSTGLPVVRLTETLPEGLDVETWMTRNIDAIAAAASRAR